MKSITIQGTKRESVGKKATKALRDAELVPCVVYGDGKTDHFSAPEKAFKDLVYTPYAHTATLKIGKEAVEAILQDIQFDPVTDHIIHADFYRMHKDRPVIMEVPVELSGRARGVMAGGVLNQPFRKLKVKALPADLPDDIQIDITSMRIGDKVYVGDIKNDKYTLMHRENAVVVAVRNSRLAVDDSHLDEEAEGAEAAPVAAPAADEKKEEHAK